MENVSEKLILEKVLLESIKEQRRTRRWRIFFKIVWLLIILSILYYALFDKNEVKISGKHVAVINLKGTISEENHTYKTISISLNNALKDKDTIAIIIRANSPGGSPVYSDMLYHEIIRLRHKYPQKPIDVVVEEVCASGCYYIAAAANNIYASPASIVGSIGVIYTGFGVTNLMQKIGVDSRLLISGKNKAMGYPFAQENYKQKLMQQKILDDIHDQFIEAVKNGRGKRLITTDPDLFSGRYWIGSEAIKKGLIDGVATVDSLSRDSFKTDNIVDFTEEDDQFEKITKKLGLGLVDGAKNAVITTDFGRYN